MPSATWRTFDSYVQPALIESGRMSVLIPLAILYWTTVFIALVEMASGLSGLETTFTFVADAFLPMITAVSPIWAIIGACFCGYALCFGIVKVVQFVLPSRFWPGLRSPLTQWTSGSTPTPHNLAPPAHRLPRLFLLLTSPSRTVSSTASDLSGSTPLLN